MPKKLLEIAADIVQTQVASNPLSSEDIVSSLRQVFCALQEMQQTENQGAEGNSEGVISEELATERMDPNSSIRDDKIICLECGAEMRQLTARHLKSHGLSLREYKRKYGFTLKQPLSARSLTKVRSKLARKRGLPANLMKYIQDKKAQKAQTAAKTPSTAPVSQNSPESES